MTGVGCVCFNTLCSSACSQVEIVHYNVELNITFEPYRQALLCASDAAAALSSPVARGLASSSQQQQQLQQPKQLNVIQAHYTQMSSK